MRIVLTGAGSGGHIFPLVAVAEELKKQNPEAEFLYIGTHGPMEQVATETMNEQGIMVKNVMTGKMRRYFSPQYFVDAFRIPLGIIQSLWHLLVYMPDAVFSKGGYASVPVVLAAWLYRIPVLTHESDAIPGWANRINGKFSHFIALSFDEARRYFSSYKAVLTGSPVRTAVLEGSEESARERWGFIPDMPVILIVGGSQGAQAINEAIVRLLPKLTHEAQILHITGTVHYESILQMAKEFGFRGDRNKYIAVPFLSREEMADAYKIAHVVISRAGANSITELSAHKKVVLFVPIAKSANDHQRMNAFSIAKAGAGIVLGERNLGSHLFMEKLEELIRSKTLREQFQTNIAQYYHPDAAQKIVQGMMQMLK